MTVQHHPQPILLKIGDAARLCSLSRSRLYELVGAGEIPTVRIGRSVRVRRTDLEQWIERLASEAEGLRYAG